MSGEPKASPLDGRVMQRHGGAQQEIEKMHSHDTKAVCRGCGLELRGKPYYMGGSAYHPVTGERCLTSHFGGHLCSENCDRRSYLEQEESMPGHGGQRHIDPNTSRQIAAKWAAR